MQVASTDFWSLQVAVEFDETSLGLSNVRNMAETLYIFEKDENKEDQAPTDKIQEMIALIGLDFVLLLMDIDNLSSQVDNTSPLYCKQNTVFKFLMLLQINTLLKVRNWGFSKQVFFLLSMFNSSGTIQLPSHRLFPVLNFNDHLPKVISRIHFRFTIITFFQFHFSMHLVFVLGLYLAKVIQGSIIAIAWIDPDAQSKGFFRFDESPSLTKIEEKLAGSTLSRSSREYMDRYLFPNFFSRRKLFWFPLLCWEEVVNNRSKDIEMPTKITISFWILFGQFCSFPRILSNLLQGISYPLDSMSRERTENPRVNY